MKPYYEANGIRIFHARWEDVWRALGLKHEDVALLWGDVPYGIRANTDRTGGTRGGKWTEQGKAWPAVAGDAAPFDPHQLLVFPRAVLWGANHYASRLPDCADWWVWDKRAGVVPERDQSDGETAWTAGVGGGLRIFRHHWDGLCVASENGAPRVHPTQKPVALATWGFQRAKLKPGDLVLSPYMGSGPEARAALDMGLRFIGCEVVEEYCSAAVNRLRQQALPLGV